MININVSKFKSLDQALKVYKQRRAKIGLDKELRAEQEYVKPSVAKRTQKLKAIYKQKMKGN
jgi:small subunit ribosomal protein S21